jgi:hypothetical protein
MDDIQKYGHESKWHTKLPFRNNGSKHYWFCAQSRKLELKVQGTFYYHSMPALFASAHNNQVVFLLIGQTNGNTQAHKAICYFIKVIPPNAPYFDAVVQYCLFLSASFHIRVSSPNSYNQSKGITHTNHLLSGLLQLYSSVLLTRELAFIRLTFVKIGLLSHCWSSIQVILQA